MAKNNKVVLNVIQTDVWSDPQGINKATNKTTGLVMERAE